MANNVNGTSGLDAMRGALLHMEQTLDARAKTDGARLRRVNREALLVMALRRLGTVVASSDVEREALAKYLVDALGDAP